MRSLVTLAMLAALAGCAGDATAVLDGRGDGEDGAWTASVDCGRDVGLRAHLGVVAHGQAQLLVKDGGGAAVFNQTYRPDDSAALETPLAGTPGEWTLSLVGIEYAGRFSITLGC